MVDDPLTAVQRDDAGRLLALAIEAQAGAILTAMNGAQLPDGSERLVRHSYGSEYQIKTTIGPVAVQRAKPRDRSASEGGADEAGTDRINSTLANLTRQTRRTRSLMRRYPPLRTRHFK